MSEIIWGIDMNNSSTNVSLNKRFCKNYGKMCELATDFGYCQLTACIKHNFGIGIKGERMSRYIDIEPLEKEGWYMARVYNDSLTSQTYETKKLKDFSTADVVERKKSEWIDFSMSIKGVPTEACGECGEWSYGMGKNFCPNCGADMRKPMTIPKEIIDSVLGYDD